MKSIFLIFTFIVATLLFSACCKVACSANDISLDFSNYRYEDVDTIYYLGYERGSNFRNLKDSNANVVPVNQRDTFRLRFGKILEINYDWIIKIPKQNKTFRFTDYEVGIDRCGCGNNKFEVLEAYTVNGIRQTNRFYTLPK